MSKRFNNAYIYIKIVLTFKLTSCQACKNGNVKSISTEISPYAVSLLFTGIFFPLAIIPERYIL